MTTAFLDDRGVVEVEGGDARALLQRLVTNDVAALRQGEARYAALLSPQGKIVVDFILADASPEAGSDRFLLDCPAGLAADLAKKLTMYRLRAAVQIADRSADLGVTAHWPAGPGFRDPRHPDLGTRSIGERLKPDPAARATYEAHRIALGVPDGGRDFGYGDAFPHDANLDRLAGVDFGKGCYVGQEVVSRVHHRGTARKRIIAVTFDGPAPAAGCDITVGEIAIGTMGTSVAGRGLATVRIDRATDAAALGAPAIADGVHLSLVLA
ncbi:MAG: YgfZ/GcvT domain-containing protein [Janthinobacterium lividum]